MLELRKYHYSDQYEVKNLVEQSGQYQSFPSYHDLGGYGIVALVDAKVVGFCWSLISKDSVVAYIDYFIVSEEYRGKKEVGHKLMDRLFVDLIKMGKQKIFGCLVDGCSHTDSLAYLYKSVGLHVKPAKYLVEANIPDVVQGIRGKYGVKNDSTGNEDT